MFVIAGLGNPGAKYENTRHNAGFMAIDVLSEKYEIPLREKKCKALLGTGRIEGVPVLLAKPQTFMNASGESIAELVHYYKIEEKTELIVLSDDINLPPGTIRMREQGSDGGHNGLKDIIRQLGHMQFMRIRIGVGDREGEQDLVSHVLGHFPPEELALVKQGVRDAADAVRLTLTKDAAAAMNEYNHKGRNQA